MKSNDFVGTIVVMGVLFLLAEASERGITKIARTRKSRKWVTFLFLNLLNSMTFGIFISSKFEL